MRDRGPDIFFRPSQFVKDLSGFGAMVVGKLFIVEIVNQADGPPFLIVLAPLPCDVAHHPFNRIGMLAKAIGLVILMKKFQGFLPSRYLFCHFLFLLYMIFLYHFISIPVK
jgi:hypothetical protein